jgi:hypothetical protein
MTTRHAALFRQSDLKRFLRATKSAGLDVKHVELDAASGKIIITTAAGDSTAAATTLDDWLASYARPT